MAEVSEKKSGEKKSTLCPKCGTDLSLGISIHKCAKCRIYVCCGTPMEGAISGLSASYCCGTCGQILQQNMGGYRRFFPESDGFYDKR